MFNRFEVDDALQEFESNFKPKLNKLFLSTVYNRELKLGNKKIGTRVKLIFTELMRSVPDEVDLDYVYHRVLVVSGSDTNPERIRICIRGSNEEIDNFSFEEVFMSNNSEQEISAWMAAIIRRLIENEYALYNLKELNIKMDDYCQRANIPYKVDFTTSLTTTNKIKYIDDYKLTLFATVEKAIDIAQVPLFSTKYDLNIEGKKQVASALIDPLKKCKTTVKFIASKYPITVFLLNTDKINIVKEIKQYSEKPFDKVIKGGTGIGYVDRMQTIGIKSKDKGVNKWVLSPFYKDSLEPVLF